MYALMADPHAHEPRIGRIDDMAPSGGATSYDRCHLMIYAALLDADETGLGWAESATRILGRDVASDREGARLCWESHLARARWIVGEGLASAVEAFGSNP